MPLIDIHNHGERAALTLTSHMAKELDRIGPDQPGWACAGIHPWEMGSDRNGVDRILGKIKQMSIEKKIIAIGETGIDRIRSPVDVEDQREILIAHADLAREMNLPLVLHSVRAHADLFSIKKKYKNSVWMIHGFIGNEKEIEQCLRHGIRLSPGIALLLYNGNREHRFFQILDRIDPSYLFLETDGVNLSIEWIYNFFCQHTGMDMDTLSSIIFENFKRDFPLSQVR